MGIATLVTGTGHRDWSHFRPVGAGDGGKSRCEERKRSADRVTGRSPDSERDDIDAVRMAPRPLAICGLGGGIGPDSNEKRAAAVSWELAGGE